MSLFHLSTKIDGNVVELTVKATDADRAESLFRDHIFNAMVPTRATEVQTKHLSRYVDQLEILTILT